MPVGNYTNSTCNVVAIPEEPVLGEKLAEEYERLGLQPPLAQEAHFPYLRPTGYYQRIVEMQTTDHGLPFIKDGKISGIVATNHYVQLYSAQDMARMAQMLEGLFARG